MYLDVVTFQVSSIPKGGFLFWLLWYLNNMWPLLLLGGLGTFLALDWARRERSIGVVLPCFLFFSNLLFIISGVLSSGFFIHYLYYLYPFASVVAILGIYRLKSTFHIKGQNSIYLRGFIVILVVTSLVTASYTVTNTLPYFYPSPYDKVDYYIGSYIHNITNPSSLVWSSEPAIGFFSERNIVAPASNFRFIGMFDVMLGIDSGVFRGNEMKGYPNGFVTPDDFVQSWKSNNVTVLVFIMNRGWVPYPDGYLWTGYRNQTAWVPGVAQYVTMNYTLTLNITCKNDPYAYYIWVKNQ